MRFRAELASSKGHIPSLDGLRAASISVVLLAHLVGDKFPGGYGVFLFFVISGFLITRLMFSEMKAKGSLSPLNFYRRRLFRLYPVILVYTCVIVFAFWIQNSSISYIEPASALFYFANYLAPCYELNNFEYQMPFKIFWSLSLEEHFYIVFPFIFMALKGEKDQS